MTFIKRALRSNISKPSFSASVYCCGEAVAVAPATDKALMQVVIGGGHVLVCVIFIQGTEGKSCFVVALSSYVCMWLSGSPDISGSKWDCGSINSHGRYFKCHQPPIKASE